MPRLKRYTDDIFATQHRADELIAAKDPEYEFWASVPEYKVGRQAFTRHMAVVFFPVHHR